MPNLTDRIRRLRQDALVLASECLDNDIRAYHALSDVAVRLTEVIQENSGTPSIVTDSRSTSVALKTAKSFGNEADSLRTIPIHAIYKGVTYKAQLDTSRIGGTGRGDCVLFDGQYMSPSAAAMNVASGQVNGWLFWRYRRDNGVEARIKELRS